MNIKKIILFSVCLLFCGCSEIKEKKMSSIQLEIETFNTLFNNKYFDETCRRISALNPTVVSLGSGIDNFQARLMRLLVRKYKIDIPETSIANKNLYHCADTEKSRISFFETAIKSNHQIIWAMRGGIGTNYIISDLNKKPIPKEKKTLIGFSDTTSMNLFVTQKWNWKAVHAPVLIHLAESVFSKEKFNTLLDILEGRVSEYTIEKVYPINNTAKKKKDVSGRLTGGNLTLIESSIGTCWEIQTKGKILFIEDINLKPQWIYRSMYHLKECGKLDDVKAIVFGKFINSGSQKEIGSYLYKFSSELNIPVYITEKFGHGNYNKPLIYNAMATLSDEKMTIKNEIN